MVIKQVSLIWLCFLSHTILSSITRDFIQLGNEDKSSPHPRRLHDFLHTNNAKNPDGTVTLLDQLDNTAGSTRAREVIVLDDSDSNSDPGPSLKFFSGPNAQKKRDREHGTAIPSSKAKRISKNSSRLETGSINPEKASHPGLGQSYKALRAVSRFIPTMASRAQDQIKAHKDVFDDMSGVWTYVDSMIKPILEHSLPGADPQAHESLTSWKFKNIIFPLFIDGIIRVQMELDKGKEYMLQRDTAIKANFFFKREVIMALGKSAERWNLKPYVINDLHRFRQGWDDVKIDGKDSMILVCEFTSPYDQFLLIAWKLVEKWVSGYKPDWRARLGVNKVDDLFKIHIKALINEHKEPIKMHEYEQNFGWPQSTYTLRKEYIMQHTSPNLNVNSQMQKSVRPQNQQGGQSPEDLHYLSLQLKPQNSATSTMFNVLSQQKQSSPLVDYTSSFQPATLHSTNPHQTSPINEKLSLNDWGSVSEKELNYLTLALGPMHNHEVLDGMIDGHDHIIHATPSVSSHSGPSGPEIPNSPLLSGVSMLSDHLSSEEQDAVVGLTALGHTSLAENGPTYRAEHVEGALDDIKNLVLDHFKVHPVKNIYQAAQREKLMVDYNNVIKCLRAARIPRSSREGVVKEVLR
ncbi:uncharacterized protein MELLADRAFT_65719 [Melampsora larici-populina 98AG31]|uniref:Secreted protein n=1 Tax=Melampsora larici-populina (strain 98AG31 / pathotype 3-4-7) TaxID=747676 RepID=F4RWG6_MELLP|nr:uncharacterized protein MELLADRAFT_65719 [Melampsora larici-populina 98AG31]EGG03280.1 hypothetical protein MELLADRAFT_65719 [Melampsora larici-populina 98AG31]